MERTPRTRKRSTKQYPAPPADAASGESASSQAKVAELVPPGSRVLDAGCANGGLAALLTARGARVWGVDVNAKAVEQAGRHCVEARAADLDAIELADVFPGLRFDVVVFADVLEHLREPWRVLESARAVLNDGGFVVASVPNVAHAAVRVAIFSGTMPYVTLGILDETHLRFFTREGVEALFEESGFRLQHIDRTVAPFEGSDLVPDVRLMRVPAEIVRIAREDPESETLQFVVRAVPLPGPWDIAALRSRLHDVQARAELQAVGLRNAERELALADERLRAAAGAEALTPENAELRARVAAAERHANELEEAGVMLAETERALEEARWRTAELEAERDSARTAADDAARHAASQVEAVTAAANAVRAGAAALDEALRVANARIRELEAALRDAEAAAVDGRDRLDEAIAQAARERAGHALERVRLHDELARERMRLHDELTQERMRLHDAHALERVRLHDAHVAELGRLREASAAALEASAAEQESLRAAHAAELAALRDDFAAQRAALEHALAERGAVLAERDAALASRPSADALNELRARLARAEAELYATRARLLAVEDHARREMLVRLTLEHELVAARDDGTEFWREPSG
ncbi:MAG TPA: methyltransferase domain-containing protein [Candidatus Elarobacter sp.]|nr:methyltransferase domain-containing protein [Candidatus Elarobacter sp.]